MQTSLPTETGGSPGLRPTSVVGRIFTRQRWSKYFLAIGVVTTIFGLLTAFSGLGLIFLLFSPLWFGLAAILRPTRPRLVVACLIMGCWIFAAFNVIF